MFIKKENRETVESFPDLLDYFGLVEDGIAFLSSGCFLAAWEVVGEDMDSNTVDQNFYRANRYANSIDFGADFGISADLIRVPATDYPATSRSDWPDPVSYLIEEERRQNFTRPGNYWRNRCFFYLTYRPVQNKRARANNWFFEDVSQRGGEGFAERALQRFKKAVDEFESLNRANMASARRLRMYEQDGQLYDELHRYIRMCINGQDDPFPLPEDPVFLNQLFADDFVGGAEPKLGKRYIATVAINGFPKSSFAGIFARLHALPFTYRFCQQSEILDTQQAIDLHDGKQKSWSAKSTSFVRKAIQNDKTIIDPHAAELSQEAKHAKLDAEYRRIIDAFYTSKIIIFDTDPDSLAEKARLVLEAMRPFSARVESMNATAAFISSLPGQMYKDKRQNNISTQNLAHFLPLGAPFLGLEHNPSPLFPAKSAPLFLASTTGNTPFRFHTHTNRDVGHTLFAGPTGSGKTTFFQLGISQWLRYPNSQVFAFDKRKTLYTLTRALGGDYYDLGPSNQDQIRLCPLQDIDTPQDLEEAATWIANICELNDCPMTARRRNSITLGLNFLAGNRNRSLTDFQSVIYPEDEQIADALTYYTVAGPSGGLLDGKYDNLRIGRFSVFEMDELYKSSPILMNAVMLYIFRGIKKRLGSRVPTLMTIDESRVAMQHPVMVNGLSNFLNEGRSLNLAVWLALQDLEAGMSSPLSAALLQQCMTKVFLPNARALDSETTAKAYRDCGLDLPDISIIAESQPKRDYYVTNHEGKRNISLHMRDAALAFFSSNDQDRVLVDQMIAANPVSWQADWLRHKNVGQNWPEFLEEILGEKKQMVAYA